MAGTVPIITAGSISGMTGLKNRPVYFLKLNNSPTPNLVVKGEQGTDKNQKLNNEIKVSIQWGSKLMKNVQNNLVNTKIMDPNEANVFLQAAKAAFTAGTPQHNNVTAAAGSYNWVKMPYVANLSDTDFLDEDTKNAKVDDAQTAIVKLADEAVWRELGVVVAVDIFNGNNDRFVLKTGKWQNYGNIMFQMTPNPAVIGLDTFDGAGWDPEFSNGHANLVQGDTYEELKILNDPSLQRQFAEKCAKGVGTAFLQLFVSKYKWVKTVDKIEVRVTNGSGDEQIGWVNKDNMEDFYLPYADAFAQGLQTGSQRLKQYLQKKAKEYDRYNAGGMAPARPSTPAPALPHKKKHSMVSALSKLNPFKEKKKPQIIFHQRKLLPDGIEKRMRFLGWI
jgi:hypothetical protein